MGHDALRPRVHGRGVGGEGNSQRQVADRLAWPDKLLDGGGGDMKDVIINALFGVLGTLAWFALVMFIHDL